MFKRLLVLTLGCMTLIGVRTFSAQSDEAERVQKAATVLEQIMSVPDKAIPTPVIKKAEAIAVFPGTIKGGLGIGAHRGKGILSVRNREAGKWSNPAFLTLTGGSFGAQIGAEEIDLVLVVMNRAGLENLLKDEFKIGADASVAAGPVGRSAEASTDAVAKAEILSYSRARGLFAGVSLAGTAIRADGDANQAYYGRALSTREIVRPGEVVVGTAGAKPKAPAGVAVWHRTLDKYTK